MEREAIRKKIREFVVENFLLDEEMELADSESFLDAGVIDSTGILEVVYFLEEEYGISVSEEEMLPENLDSIERMGRFVASKLEA